MSRHVLSATVLAVAMTACNVDTPPTLSVAQAPLASPAGPDSGEPFLSTSDGGAYLTWLEVAPEGGHDFRMAEWSGSAWSEPRTIAHRDRFFVNWADFPSLSRGQDGTLWAHWLERGAEGGYDYGIRIVRSHDAGVTWSEPLTPHGDDSPTEHGFVSTVTAGAGAGFAWLDGRQYAPGPDGTEATEEMSLRYRWLRPDGESGPEELVDGRVCDCCQTASAMTEAGPVVVYRNRSEDEIRDIYIARRVDGEWLAGSPVHADGWNIAGCPVNGPAVVAAGAQVAVAWFTAPGDVPRVKVAFSGDAGATFGEAIVIDDGNPGGRVDIVQESAGSVLVSWLERTGGDQAEVRIRRVMQDGTISGSAALTSASADRATGFPRLVRLAGGDILLAWTDVAGVAPQVRVARLDVQ